MPGAVLILALALARARGGTPSTPRREMIIAAPPNQEVLIAWRADDGTLETACVHSDDAAKPFLARARRISAKRENK